MDDLIPVAVGALLAAGAGFIGAWIQSRREHARWVRERRHEAYVDFLHIVLQTSVIYGRIEAGKEKAREIRDTHQRRIEAGYTQDEIDRGVPEVEAQRVESQIDELKRAETRERNDFDLLERNSNGGLVRFSLLGPSYVWEAAGNVIIKTGKERMDAMPDLEREMRRALKLDDWEDGERRRMRAPRRR